MSTTVRWIIAVLIIAALAWLVWWSGWLTGKKPVMAPAAANNTQATTTPPAPTNGMSASNDASNAAITQDTAAIDTQMQAYGTDTTNVDSSMSDKQVTQ